MNRKLIVFVVLIIALIGLLVYVDASRPRPIDWRPTYVTKDKIPFGLYVLDKEAPTLFKGNKLLKIKETPYEFFDSLYDYKNKKYKSDGTFINIAPANDMDYESAMELVYFADHGNTVFLSMQDFPQLILDTLKVTLTSHYTMPSSLYLSTENNSKKNYKFEKGLGITYFDSIDTKTTQVLGYEKSGRKKWANFIKVPFGSGQFILHSQPTAFTNYNLLKDNNFKYTQKVLSAIPQENVYWYSEVFIKRNNISRNKLRYILSQPALKWAMWIGLLGLLVYILFNFKRKQRVIPEIAPLKNTTVDFAKTIGNLYYQEGNHHTIIEKKIIYFLEHVRNEYNIDTYSLDEAFIEKMHLKTGKPVEEIEKTVSLIKKHRHGFQSTEADVLAINKAIENLRS